MDSWSRFHGELQCFIRHEGDLRERLYLTRCERRKSTSATRAAKTEVLFLVDAYEPLEEHSCAAMSLPSIREVIESPEVSRGRLIGVLAQRGEIEPVNIGRARPSGHWPVLTCFTNSLTSKTKGTLLSILLIGQQSDERKLCERRSRNRQNHAEIIKRRFP
jgi:hypothetical protein